MKSHNDRKPKVERSIKGQRPRTGSVPDESSRRVDLIEKVADESAMVVE